MILRASLATKRILPVAVAAPSDASLFLLVAATTGVAFSRSLFQRSRLPFATARACFNTRLIQRLSQF
jgi:hypothetical protein